jgi:hypothetical protein
MCTDTLRVCRHIRTAGVQTHKDIYPYLKYILLPEIPFLCR